jgi:hypothetical protein
MNAKNLIAIALVAALPLVASAQATLTQKTPGTTTTTTGTTGTPGAINPHGGKAGPCEQIKLDCESKGYIAGEAGEGKGLWWDCMCPLIAQNFPEPTKNVLTPPSDSSLVPACRQHPHGQQIQQRCASMMAKKGQKQGSH